MNFYELTKTRESCRSYLGKQVLKEDLDKIFKSVSNSPSACNSQPYEFLCVFGEKKSILAKLVQDNERQINKFSDEAPCLIVVIEKPAKLLSGAEKRCGSQYYAQMDVGIAVATLCYAAAELGLSTCILGYLEEAKIKELFSIDEADRIRLVISLGYNSKDARGRKTRKDMLKLMKIIE